MALNIQHPAEPAVRRIDFDERELLIHAAGDWRGFRSAACAKEPETANWLRRVARSGTVFYDIGACVGSYSLIASALGATVHAFEPSALNYTQLQSNIWLNRSSTAILEAGNVILKAGKITAWPVALTSESGPLRIGLSSLHPGAASHKVISQDFKEVSDPVKTAGQHPGSLQPERAEQAAIGFALDEFVARFLLPQPANIKIDVDGGEVSVLEGARDTIKSAGSVMVEVNAHSLTSVAAILLAAGLEETGSWPRTGGQSNHLFERVIG